MSGEAIKVCCRYRYETSPPPESGGFEDWEFDKETGEVKLGSKNWNFDFNLGWDSTQEEMYDRCAKYTITEFLDGKNGTIFAYGQSGSGKTFSMLGPDSVTAALVKDFKAVSPDVRKLFGIIPRAVEQIYEAKSQFELQGDTCVVKASYIEVYNESIRCLLTKKEDLKICSVNDGFVVPGKDTRVCNKPEQIFEVISIATQNREVSGTGLNARSSRSHTILVIDMQHKDLAGVEKNSTLNLVDLAGSEKTSKTGITKQDNPKAFEEALRINQSLTTLGLIIMSLATGKKLGSVRDSKLTMILKESLGGNAKTTLLVAANRWKNNVDESVNTLDFAKRAKQIKNKCKSNIQINPKELQYFVEYMKEEILKLRGQLKAKGIDYHKISDKKVKTIIKDEEFVMEDGSTPVEEEKASPNKSVAGKRNSIIGLSEQDIIIKYCEMRAKYDNLLQSAGSAIYSLNKSVEQSSDQVQNASYEINSLKVETDEKLQQIVNQKNQEITSLNEKIEALKKQHEKSEEELNAKHTQLLKAKLKIEDELDSSKKDYESLQSMFEMTSNDVQVFQQELEEEKKKLEEKEEEIKNIKLEIEAKSESLKDVQGKLSDSENKNKETLEKLEEMSNKFLLEAENFKNITKQYEDLENRFNSQTKAFSEEKEKFHESLLQSEKKYTEVNNKLCELELKYENEVKSSTDKDAFNQTQIQNLKQENENLNRLIKENTSGQEILAEKEKILEQTKFYLEKRIEEVEDECGNLKQQLIETVTKSNNEKGALSLEIENLNFNLKVKNEEIQTRDVEFETFKKNQENRFNVEVLKSEQLLSRLDNSEKKISELENLNNDLTSNDKKLTFENNLLNKKIDEKQNLLEMQKSLITKYEEDIQKAHKDNKEIKDGIKENSNRLRELEAEVKKYENDKKLLESEVEFKNKKVQDAEQKLKEQKAENKVMQETIRNLQKKIDELELENTRQKRVANIPVRKDEAPKEKMNVFSAFGVTLKKTTNAYTEKLREEEREGQLRTKLIFKDNEEELKKLHACIDNSSPKTVSSRSFDEIPDIDFGEDICLEKAALLYEQREKINEEKRIKKESERDSMRRGSGMIID